MSLLETYIGVHNVQVKVNITTHTLALDFLHKNIYSLSNTITNYTKQVTLKVTLKVF